jgi:hypothetical protein
MRCASRVMIVVVVARRDTDRCGYGSWPGKRSSPSWTFNEGTARVFGSMSSSHALLRDFPTLWISFLRKPLVLSQAPCNVSTLGGLTLGSFGSGRSWLPVMWTPMGLRHDELCFAVALHC